MTPRDTLTVVAPVRGDRLAEMGRVIDRIAADVRDNPLCPFGRMETVHYARWVFLEPTMTPDGKERIPAELVFTTVHDGSLDEHIDELLRHGREGIDSLYSLCDGYPALGNRNDTTRKKYLRDHSLPTAAFYGAHDGRGLAQIRLENRLRRFLDGFVDTRREEWIAGKTSSAEIQQQLLREVRDNEEFTEAPVYAAQSTTWPPRRIVNFTAIVLFAFAALAILPIILTLFLIWLAILRYHEKRDASAEGQRSPEHLDNLASAENLFTQSQITVISWVKPGWFRQLTLRLLLFSANLTSRVLLWPSAISSAWSRSIMPSGSSSIKANACCSSAILMVSWESYIGDFVDKAHIALTPIWTNCIGFPETPFLFFGGAAREENFKDLVRDNQLPTHVWYAAYPSLSVANINDASDINRGLYQARRSSTEWLALL